MARPTSFPAPSCIRPAFSPPASSPSPSPPPRLRAADSPTGTVVTSFAPATDIGAIVAAAPDSSVRFLAVTSNGVRRLGADGTVEPTSSFGLSVFNASAILPLPDGRALIGGGFASQTHLPSATPSSRTRLFRLNADATGTVDPTYAPSLLGTVTILAPGAGGKIYIGSEVTLTGTTGTLGLQRLLADGTADPTFVPPPLTGVAE